MKQILIPILACITVLSCKEKQTETVAVKEVTTTIETKKQLPFEIMPVSHATMVLQWDGTTIYIDPVGGAQAFASYPKPDLILVTDIHGDHLNVKTLEGLDTSKAKIIVPQAVADKMPEAFVPQVDVLNNGDSKERFGFSVEATPMYNLREEALKFHTKGRGNGYVIEKDGTRIYISGDTEDIPEMRALKNIDAAFVCMNLPYTMTEVSAADAVLEFAPKTIYPYHYRGTEGLSDVANFKTIVNKGNPAIKVVQLDWYEKK
ncbi:MAG: L-ascorbate metabolism protein UlaG (beta-lactamase superfamily) [Dokdonia sp.]|jgi:L-ascorbate metabolism protein UlaG (beta-lactamase superfamily)